MTTPSLSRSPLIHALPSLCVTSSCARMCAWPPVLLLQAKVQWVNGLPQEPSKGPGEYPPWSIPANLPSWERGLSPQWVREVVLCTIEMLRNSLFNPSLAGGTRPGRVGASEPGSLSPKWQRSKLKRLHLGRLLKVSQHEGYCKTSQGRDPGACQVSQ